MTVPLDALRSWLDTGDGPCPDSALQWLCREVLPTLRRTGSFEGYATSPFNPFDLLFDPLTGLLRDIRTVWLTDYRACLPNGKALTSDD